MKIGTFITQYPYDGQLQNMDKPEYYVSGAERVAKEIVEGLSDADGYDSEVFTSSASFRNELERINDVTIHRYGSAFTVNTTKVAPGLSVGPLRHDIDLVHAHSPLPPAIVSGYLYSKARGVPFIITHHGGENYVPYGSQIRKMALKLYNEKLFQHIFNSADCITVSSGGYIEESSVLGDIEDKVQVIPNGVEVAEYDLDLTPVQAKEKLGYESDSFIVLFMNTHYPRKGPQVLLKGFRQFSDQYPNSKLIMAGTGPITDDLERKSNRDIIFTGYVPEDKKPLYMKAADTFVLPTTAPSAEVFPLSILEANAAGTSAIVSDFPTIRSATDGYDNVELVTPDDADALADALESEYYSFKKTGGVTEPLQMAQDHSWPEIIKQYSRLYKQVLR